MRCNVSDIKYDEVANTMSMSYDGIRLSVDWADFKYANGELLLEFDERMFLGNNVIFTNSTNQLSFLYAKNADEQQTYDFLSQTNVVIRIGNLMLSLVHTPGQYYFTYRIDNVFIVQNEAPVMPPIDMKFQTDTPVKPPIEIQNIDIQNIDKSFNITYIDKQTGKEISSATKM